MYRRVEEAWHLRLDGAGALAPVRLAAIDGERSPSLTGAQRMPEPPMLPTDGGRTARPLHHDAGAYAVLAGSLGLGAEAFETELDERQAFMEDLAARGICDPPSVATAIRDFGASTD
jgi:hypothetical protein